MSANFGLVLSTANFTKYRFFAQYIGALAQWLREEVEFGVSSSAVLTDRSDRSKATGRHALGKMGMEIGFTPAGRRPCDMERAAQTG